MMLRSLYLYAKYFLFTMFSGEISFLFKDFYSYYLSGNRFFSGKAVAQKQHKLALAHAVECLLQAQDASPDDGIASYHLVNGWTSSYPETTGYIIPSLLEYAARNNDKNIRNKAVRAADWLLGIQKPSGGWQGGRINENKAEIVFNTAQIIRGLLAVYSLSKDQKYIDGAIKAGDWLCHVQDKNGGWTKHALMGRARVYDSYVDYPLLLLYRETGIEKYKHAATKNLDWIVTKKQHKNAWFEDCDNTVKRNNRPILHTIAYTIDGLLDCGIYLDKRKYIQAAKKAADVLKDKFDKDGFLHGRYDMEWNGSEHMILTGCAQMSVIWLKIAHYSGNRTYFESASRMNALLIHLQNKGFKKESVNTTGALNGSYPLWGRYEPFAFPNWAAKYLADALMLEEDN